MESNNRADEISVLQIAIFSVVQRYPHRMQGNVDSCFSVPSCSAPLGTVTKLTLFITLNKTV